MKLERRQFCLDSRGTSALVPFQHCTCVWRDGDLCAPIKALLAIFKPAVCEDRAFLRLSLSGCKSTMPNEEISDLRLFSRLSLFPSLTSSFTHGSVAEAPHTLVSKSGVVHGGSMLGQRDSSVQTISIVTTCALFSSGCEISWMLSSI